MAVTTQSGAPTVIEAGDTYIFTENFSDYPAATWNAAYLLQITGSAPYISNAAANGNTFLFTLNATNTRNFTPGRYSYSIYVTEISSSQRATSKTSVVQVLPDLTQTQSLSSAATMLAAVNTALTQLASGGFVSVSVNNVSYTRQNISELYAWRTRLQAEVIRERDAADAFRGIETNGMISTRFKCS
jgi:hypothetical protein